MGNESSTTEALPEDGAPENVVLFPPQENQNDPAQSPAEAVSPVSEVHCTVESPSALWSSLLGEAHAESSTKRDNKSPLSETVTGHQSLLSQPVLPDIPVITGLEESGIAGGEQEDKEELEFPHDLLPSLDFSSELNIWESSLGCVTQTSSGQRECERVNPLLAGLQHHVEVSPTLMVLSERPHDSDPVLTDAQTSPKPPATPSLGEQPLSPPPSMLLDLELQEAFQECEDQMASLGIFNPKESSSMSESANDVGKKTGKVMVNMSNESSPLPPIVVQPGHSNRGHGNKSTHGNSETSNTQKDTVVFSFRNYILGNQNGALAAETESEIKAVPSLDKCTKIEPETETHVDEQKEIHQHTHLETAASTDLFKETPKYALLNEQRENEEKHVVSNATTEANGTVECNAVITEKDTERVADIVDVSSFNVCIVESGMRDGAVNETLGSSTSYLKGRDAFSDLLSEAQTVPNQSESKTDKQTNLGTNKRAEQDKENENQEEVKRMERSVETEQAAKTGIQSENDVKPECLINAGIHTDSDVNAGPVPQADTRTVICGKQPDNGFDYKQQLSLRGMPSSTPPLSFCHSRQDHFTASAFSPVSNRAFSQRAHQSDNDKQTNAPCGLDHHSDKIPQHGQHVTEGVIDNQNTALTTLPTTVTNPAASADKRSDAQTQEAIVTTKAVIFTQENLSPLTNSATCVGESYVESALDEGLAVVAPLPLTTPTMPEVIESKRGREGVRRDSLESVATVAIAEREKEGGEKDLEGIEKCLSSADEERKGLLDSLPPLPLICSLALSARGGQVAFEKSCNGRMPHNSVETETKGPSERTICSTDTEISPAEEGDREKQPPRLEAYINTSPLRLHTGPDFRDQSAVGLEEAREGGGGGGLASEHSSFGQPEGSASGVSSAETQRCPPINVAESQLKSQSWSEPTATITESLCTERERLSQPCQEQHCTEISPHPPRLEQSSSNTIGGLRDELKQYLISVEAPSLGHSCEESSITETEQNNSQDFLSSVSPQPLSTSQQIPVEQQASNVQQVQPESSTTEDGTAEFQIQAQTQSSSGSGVMSGVGVYVRDSSGGNYRVHFADTVKQEVISSVDLRNMSVPAMDCASLPPLTVHESLHHPVVEASYIFPDFLNQKRPEIPTNAAPTKPETATQSSADFPKTQKDVQLDKEDLETKDIKGNIAIDQSASDNLVTNTVDLQLVTEACTKLLSCPSEKNQTSNEESFDILQRAGGAVFEGDRTQVSATLMKQEEAEAEKDPINLCLSKGKEVDKSNAESKGSINTDQPQGAPLRSNAVVFEEKEGNQHPVSSQYVLPPENTCKPLSEVSAELPVGLVLSHQPYIDLNQTPSCVLITTDPTKASERPRSTIQLADLKKDESLTSEVQASEQPVPITELYASNPTSVLQPPGPMLSHLEFISDCDISRPELIDKYSADGDSTKVSKEMDGNSSREMSSALEQDDICDKVEEICPKPDDQNYAMESVVEPENFAIHVVNIPFSQEQNLSPSAQPPSATDVLTKGDSDMIIPLSQTEQDYIGIKADITKASIREDLINVSCPFSSAMPTNKASDEIKQDNMKEKYTMGDETSMLFEKKTEQTGEMTTNNQKETANGRKLQTEKAGTILRHNYGPDKDAIEETRDMQPSHNVEKTESPIRHIIEEGEGKSVVIASESYTENCCLVPNRPAGLTGDMLSAEVESGCEPQTFYDQNVCQTMTATLERNSDRDAAPHLSGALSQSQLTPDPNSFAQQQEQQEQCLGSSGLKSQVMQTQIMVPGSKGVEGKGDSGVGHLCQSVCSDQLTSDDRSKEQMIGLEREEEEGAQAVSGTDTVYMPSYFVNESVGAAEREASAELGIVTSYTNVRETREEMDKNKSPQLESPQADTDLMPGTDFVNYVGGKAQIKSKLSAIGQNRHEKPETSMGTAVSVESPAQEYETFQISVSTKLSADSQGIFREVTPSENQAEEITSKAAKVFTTLPDFVRQPKTVEKDFSAATEVKGKSNETKECEIQDTVWEPLELQSSNKLSTTQSSPVVQTPIKSPEVDEITKEDKTALNQQKVGNQGKVHGEMKVTNNEATEKQVVIIGSVSAENSDSGLFKASGPCEIVVSHNSTEPTVCLSGRNIFLSEATENDSGTAHKITPGVVIAPSVVSSKCLEDFASAPLTAPTQSEKPYDQVSKPLDDNVINLLCPVEPVCVNKESSDLSESSTFGQTAQEPDTNWIKALREAASQSQSEQVNTVDMSRPLPSLESPQLEFLTPTEEIAAPPREAEILSPEVAAEKTREIQPVNVVKKPVDLPKPLKKSSDLLEPTQKTVELIESLQSTKVGLPEESTKEDQLLSEPKRELDTYSDIAEKPLGLLEPTKSTAELPEPAINDVLLPVGTKNDEPKVTKTAETLESEKKPTCEVVERPVELPPEKQFNIPAEETALTETVQRSAEKRPDSGASLADQAERGDCAPDFPPPPTTEHHLLPALPPHLTNCTEFPTPPPTPPERHETEGLPTPPVSPCASPPPAPSSPLAPSAYQYDDRCPASAPCHPPLRSSDSDGAFETPESTTPVKAASPTDCQSQQLTSDDQVADTSVSDLACDVTSAGTICRSPSIVFDENKPIAASGTYNIEVFADSASHTLTRSLSLQGGELDSSGPLDEPTTGDFRPHSESFSIGTDSAPGTLYRPKKIRTGSLKKKPLLRQNSNPESPKPASSSSTPEIKKRTKPRTASPLQAQEETEAAPATPSPGGTLRKTRKSRVETPPPLPEEINHNSQEEILVTPALPLCQEETSLSGSPTGKDESPIPPSASYKWDPDNFENIDPFKTGGSKIANSPVLGRKDPVCATIATPPGSPPLPTARPPAPLQEPITNPANPEEQPIIPNRQSVRLEFDYSEESSEAPHQASPVPKKVGKKPSAKMPLRKPKLGLKKAPPQTEQLDNDPPLTHNGNEDEICVPKASYKFDPDKWEDPNFNPFTSKRGITNSPKLSRPSYTFDPSNFDDSIDPFKSSNKMASSPPKASASFELSSNDYDNENDNDNIGELEDQNQNKPAKKKKTPIKSVKRSPKKSPLFDPSQDSTPIDESPSLHQQDDHATDEEKLASSTSHKWAALQDLDADVNSDQQDFPQPCDLTSFVNENSLPHQTQVQDYEIEYMEKIGSSSPPPSVKKPSLYLKLDSVSDNLTKKMCADGSEPSSPCTGSFEEMEAQITAGMKTPVLSARPGPEGSAGDKGRKRESESLSRTQSTEREEQPHSQGPEETPAPALAMPLLDRLSECDDPLQYLEPDLAETNPTAFAQKLQEELVLAALRIEALQVAKNISQCPSLSNVTPQHRDVSSPLESAVCKNSLYARSTATAYIEGESPHLPGDLDHSLGIAREEIVIKEKEVLEWQKKYEDSRQEVVEMRRIVAEYEKTIAQMIEDDQKEKSLSHHTIQQLIIEKDQALADLNSVEKSLADLFRRYEKMKDVLEGFRKNEEVLKKCAQEYLSRVRKEEQRYNALKIHAEEKLDKANAEIAQVRAKAKQEQAAYQASVRKEQMKVDSLERTLEQKNKEIEELTKICDELIAKMGRS
ncbi:microtubule-associated protein futsch isoform X5 [Channa argus]|uniref:microtubule-associated protein futsch isoform X5 n=1 Tax=Channa argus TaxID=215402 RepID=UPI003522CB34